ncbi:hypothetical protein CKN53_10260 [Acinetobacter baumannii]|uniref:Uncharacterized protein n=4 Tax=Acinetobacter baumannii TaxID=470 RepID=A0A0D5YJE9_ACIBA|nr:hypothetical protein AB57_1395 [Acinetobacter baumannii AB0057]AJF81223.1 hypothetical protein ABA1_01325 [Acinetobacter baumannii]ATY44722.1 hypothetical protein ABBFA_02288 [Acinetobacter baumannii AB307-0294]EJO41065.1 hypothetical protein ACINBC5_A1574 [Acinetobacter baumannii Canada BC-5]EKA75064.1 hypothetical protein ACINIS58_1343 [Acinetobacter baumannii IS-58]EKK07680.1 hypothetical protein ACINIS235_1336 [Acinetobacter baumannii IS-235]EKK17309.1 hypothetical protein ACINIS251_12
MSKQLEQMKIRLSAVAHGVQIAVGDAFNLDNFAKLLLKLESIDEMTPQLAEAQAYAKYLPIEGLEGAVIGSASVLQRKKGVGRGKRFSGQGNDVPLAEVMYDSQASNGYQGGNEEPGNVNAPSIFEPPLDLTDGKNKYWLLFLVGLIGAAVTSGLALIIRPMK